MDLSTPVTWRDQPAAIAQTAHTAHTAQTAHTALDDEHADLEALLLAHASHPGILARHVARGLAEACMGPRHLWEDLGLANRGQLNALMAEHFTALHQRNVNNMRWKKFFYRLLCEQAEVMICKSPHCSQCEDQPLCFDGSD